jgi:tetratricopeptide (TPR) repeat protein
MPYQLEEDESLQRQRLSGEATNLAVQGRWEEAAKLNKKIIERFPSDIKAYNRLGRALTELGEIAQAREAYLTALELAPANAIAKKNITRLDSLPESKVGSNNKVGRIIPELFVAESTKSGIVTLHNLAPSEVLARVNQGDQVQLNLEEQRLVVTSGDGIYLGEVEPKHSSRLVKLIKGGNKYVAAIFGMEATKVQVIIKEIYQRPDQSGIPSFPGKIIDSSHPYAGGKLLGWGIDDKEEAEHFEEEVEDSSEEMLPDGFSVIEDIE